MKKTIACLLTLSAAAVCFAALPATTVWEVRTDGAATNGGGFVPGSGGFDYSQQAAPQSTVNDAVMSSVVPTITSASASWPANVVGNIAHWSGGSFPGVDVWFHIVARADANSLVVDRTSVNSTGGTFIIGGAMNHPSMVQKAENIPGVGTAGFDVWVKAGTYNFDNTGTGQPAGRLQTVGSASDTGFWEGYQTTRGDRGTKPVFRADTLTTNAIVESLGYTTFINIEADCNGKTVDGFTATANSRTILCLARSGVNGFNTTVADRCIAIENGVGFQNCPLTFGCVASGNTTTGFLSSTSAIRCIDIGSPGGFSMNAANQRCINCVSYGGTGNGGFQLLSTNNSAIACVAVNRIGKGFYGVTNGNAFVQHCAGFNNSGGNTDSTDTRKVQDFIALSADPFVNAAGGNFALNATTGGGASLMGTGIPAIYPNGTTTSTTNVGAVENSGVVAGSSYVFIQ